MKSPLIQRGAPCRFTIACVLGALALFAGGGRATTPTLIPVQNPGFEDPVLAPGSYTNATPAGWQEGTPNGPNSFTEHIPGFSMAGNNHEGIASGGTLWQDLDSPLTPNTQYSLIIGIGHRDAVSTRAGNQSVFKLQLSSGFTLASRTVDATAIPQGTFRTFQVNYVTGASPPAGTLRIQLQVNTADRAHFDEVQLVGVPTLESRSGAAGLLYLDFDGETVTDPHWNAAQTFTVAPSGMSAEQVRKAFEVVKEDFLPFNINVTTRRELYDARSTAPYRRMRCIITPTFQWYADSGGGDPSRGLSYIDSFRTAGSVYSATVPAFVFIRDLAAGVIREDALELGGEASHELGHTLGLHHDTSGGIGYFPGNGGQEGPLSLFRGLDAHLNVWGSIMGAVDGNFITQWCKGDYFNYASAQPNPDDVGVIAGTGVSGNGLGYAADDIGDTPAAAKNIPLTGSTYSGGGFIGRTVEGGTDDDVFKLVLPAPGVISLLVRPAEPVTLADPVQAQFLNLGVANLYLEAELLSSGGGLIENLAPGAATPVNASDPDNPSSLQSTEFLRKRTTRVLAAGTYYLRISPLEFGYPFLPPYDRPGGGKTTHPGFTNYGSMGAYSISGSVVWTVPQVTSPLVAAGVATQAFAPYQASATAGPVAWTASGLPNGLTINGSTGIISGTPAVSGSFHVVLRASTAMAYGEATLVLTITAPAPPAVLGPFTDTTEQGQAYSNQITASGGPTTYSITGNAIPGLSVNATTGAIAGTPFTVGTQSMALTVSNQWGSGSHTFILTVRPAPATALDTTTLVFTRPDSKKWFGQNAVSSDGTDAMQSPALNHGESSSIETTVTGPGTISYYWRADTEPGDTLTFRSGVSLLDTVSGSTAWLPRSQTIPAGLQTLRWTFARNAGGSGGSDTVWLDRVTWSPPSGAPVFTSPASVTWTAGAGLSFDITATNNPTSYSLTGTVPPGMFYSPTMHFIVGVPGRSGTWPVTLTATNAAGTGMQEFTMTVESSYTGWARANGLGAGSELGDQDRDGITNLAELAFALNPFVRNPGFQPLSFDPVTRRMRASFQRQYQIAPDLLYEVQVSSNLLQWTAIAGSGSAGMQNLGGALSVAESNAPGNPSVTDVVVVDGTPVNAGPTRRWMRVRISQW